MPDQLTILRIAHEHASFPDYRIRDAINATFKQLEADFDEIGLEVSDSTLVAFKELQDLIDEIETPRVQRRVADLIEIEEVEAREIPPLSAEDDNVRVIQPEEFVRKIHTVSDDELEEV